MNINEGFDFSGMSDIDYTDTFADMDESETDRITFTAALRKALLILVCKPNGANDWVKGTDPRLDPLFAGAVSGSPADGWRVSFSATALKQGGTGLKPASSSFAHLYGNAFPAPAGGAVMDVVLNLKAVSAARLKSVR